MRAQEQIWKRPGLMLHRLQHDPAVTRDERVLEQGSFDPVLRRPGVTAASAVGPMNSPRGRRLGPLCLHSPDEGAANVRRGYSNPGLCQ